MTITNFESSKQIVILCDFCFQEITFITRIKCECQLDICIKCFFISGCSFFDNKSVLEKYKLEIDKKTNFFPKKIKKSKKNSKSETKTEIKHNNQDKSDSNNELQSSYVYKLTDNPLYTTSQLQSNNENTNSLLTDSQENFIFNTNLESKSDNIADTNKSENGDIQAETKKNESINIESQSNKQIKNNQNSNKINTVAIEHENHVADPHSANHRYYCIEPLDYTVIDPKWNALEELIFFEMLSLHGIGNWVEIANVMKTKTVAEIEEHFYLLFKIENDKTLENEENMKGKLSEPNNHVVSIYAPKRRDFDFEEEYEQENSLKFLEQTETPEIKEFLIDSYRNLINLRKIKKEIIFEKKLLEINKVKAKKEKIMKNYLSIYTLCANLTQFISKKDLNEFFNGLIIEKFLLGFKGNKSTTNLDCFAIDLQRKNNSSKNEINLIEKLNVTYSTYVKIKKHAVLSHLLTEHITTLRKLSNDCRCDILLEYFKKKKLLLS